MLVATVLSLVMGRGTEGMAERPHCIASHDVRARVQSTL